MRIASFNVENLFSRVRAMRLENWEEGREVLAEYSQLTTILQAPVYTEEDKREILAGIERLGLAQSDGSDFVRLRQNRGRLLRRSSSGGVEVEAGGRGDWVGWLELKREAVEEISVEMTARVIQDVGADVLGAVEAEDRIALIRFNEQLLRPAGAPYDGGIMLIDGNDERGIDVGLLTKPGHRIERIVSHVDDTEENGSRVFSRDCPEFTVRVGEGDSVLVLVKHFKSKGYGSQAASDAKRKSQARRVREVYEQRRAQGVDLICVLGDLNDTPESEPLRPLLGEGSDLRGISEHPLYTDDGRPGTYDNGTRSNKIDYVLLSPALFEGVTAGGVWRKGVWGGKNGTLFPHYEEMKNPVDAASDHAAIWADVDL